MRYVRSAPKSALCSSECLVISSVWHDSADLAQSAIKGACLQSSLTSGLELFKHSTPSFTSHFLHFFHPNFFQLSLPLSLYPHLSKMKLFSQKYIICLFWRVDTLFCLPFQHFSSWAPATFCVFHNFPR